MTRPSAEATALVEHRARHLAAAQEITHIGSWEWDLAGAAVVWSDELYRIYGLAPGSREITLEVFLSMVHPDDRARIQEEVGRALERGGRFAYGERIVRPDGSVRHLDTVGNVVPGPDGRPIALIGTCRDITEQRERDEALRLHTDIVRNMQIGVAVWRVDDPEAPLGARLVTQNPAAARLTVAATSEPGARLDEVFPMAVRTELPAVLGAVARDGSVRELASYALPSSGGTRYLHVRAFPLPERAVGLAFEDVTDDARGRSLRAAEQRTFERIAAGAALADVLRELVLTIEAHMEDTFASVLLLDESGQHVRHGAAPSLPAAYNEAVDGQPIGPRAGSCGTAAFLKVPVFASDIETDERWAAYREVARAHGLRACWSMPILVTGDRVVGTFAMYYRQPRSPTPEDVELITRATHVAGIAIQRHELDERLRALSAHIEAVLEEERTSVAREIHDELGQALTALKIDVAWVKRHLGHDAEPALERLASISDMIDEIIDSVRRISSGLRPGVLDELGLVAAVEWQTEDFEQRTGATCAFGTNLPDDEAFPRPFATAVFRMLQEALTNVARHAGAASVEVALRADADRIRLEVRDDGRGISPAALASSRSLGLLGVRERARRLGGTLSIEGGDGAGTSFVVELPRPPRGGR